VPTLNIEVTELLNNLNLPLRDAIELLRNIITNVNTEVKENIKWNSPNYNLNGNDLITLKVQPNKTKIQIIFHRGAKVKVQPEDKIIAKNSDFLTWKSNDRAIATFTDILEIIENQDLIIGWITTWLDYIDLA
jgi:uncharacterized protein YdhG (YjbR/CyaY superfamily)